MTECLPDRPVYYRVAADGSWEGADHRDGPWRPVPVARNGLPWMTDGPAVPESREPASVAPEAKPSYSDRLALAVCTYNPLYPTPCREICPQCRKQAAKVAHELAAILRERHGGSSTTADWLDGVGCHPGTVQGTVQEAW